MTGLPHAWDQGQGRWRCRRCGTVVNPQRVDVSTLPACRLRLPRPEPQPIAIPEPIERDGRLAAIACYFNPAGFSRLKANYQRFVHEVSYWQVPLYAVEVAFGDTPYVDLPLSPGVHVHRIKADDRHVMFLKERLLNIAETLVPADYDSIAWIDADVAFYSSTWVADTLSELQRFPVVQLFDRWHFLSRSGTIINNAPSVGLGGQRYDKPLYGTPGGAWAARREVFPLYEHHILGGGDVACLDAWLGREHSRLVGQMSHPWRAHWRQWADRAYQQVGGLVNSIPGDAVHYHHGSVQHRRYAQRGLILQRHDYDPALHIEVDDCGLFRWTDHAPDELREEVRQYFIDRKEDA